MTTYLACELCGHEAGTVDGPSGEGLCPECRDFLEGLAAHYGSLYWDRTEDGRRAVQVVQRFLTHSRAIGWGLQQAKRQPAAPHDDADLCACCQREETRGETRSDGYCSLECACEHRGITREDG